MVSKHGRSSWTMSCFAFLGVCLPRAVAASCENSITVRTTTFVYSFEDVAPYKIEQGAAADSIFRESTGRNYDNLARGLAVAAQIYRCLQADQEVARAVADETGGELLTLKQSAGHHYPTAPFERDPLVDLLKPCVRESTTTLYSVQIGSFLERPNAVTRFHKLAALAATPHETSWDSTRIVDWWNWSCCGDSCADLFILPPDGANGPGFKVLHGLFIDRGDAIVECNRVREKFRFGAVVVPVRVTGPILRTALSRPEGVDSQ